MAQFIDPGHVLREPSVAHLRAAELPLEHVERVLDLGSHAGLGTLDLLGDEPRLDEPRTPLAP